MSLTLDEVKRIAWLARIEVSEAEAAVTRDQLNGIFKLIGQMQQVDTDGIEPMSHAQDVALRLREDRANDKPEPREEFQAIAPQVENGLYLVPKVIE